MTRAICKVILLSVMAIPSLGLAQTLQEQAQAFSETYDKHFNAKDAEGLASMFSEGAIVNSPRGPVAGADIPKFWADVFKSCGNHVVQVTNVNPGTTLLWAVGTWAADCGPQDKQAHVGGHWGATYDSQGGQTKLSTLTWNTPPPPANGTK